MKLNLNTLISDARVGLEYAVLLAPGRISGVKIACHHIACMVAHLVRKRGHSDVRLVHGIYETEPPNDPIWHSWLVVGIERDRELILEINPRQLAKNGGYVNDRMLCDAAEVLPLILIIPDSCKVDNQLEEECRVIVDPSGEVMDRYREDQRFDPAEKNVGYDRNALESLCAQIDAEERQASASDEQYFES